jgi:hypothetical protein
MFRLTRTEAEALNRSQIVTGYQKHRTRAFRPSPSPSTKRSWAHHSQQFARRRDEHLRRACLREAARDARRCKTAPDEGMPELSGQ